MRTQAIELPATVSQFAAATGLSKTTVRRSIAAGTLKVDEKLKPKTIVAGELLWTAEKWMEEFEPHLTSIKRHLRGWDSDGNLSILRGTSIERIERGFCSEDLKRAVRAVENLLRQAL